MLSPRGATNIGDYNCAGVAAVVVMEARLEERLILLPPRLGKQQV